MYRHYRYVINNSKFPNLFINNWSWHRYQKVLDEVLMLNASKTMEGEHDFFAFQKSGSNRSNSITNIKNININTTRIGLIKILNMMGAKIKFKNTKIINGEKCSDIK